ncbi:CsbD family protein [Sphaerisporangium album]|uniref:CsbD family protein n=1 Tax=Sphaerisporangium album TaxID=509200 RepID=A0A367FMH4_9ACTN|nr:CsbD family protein [Sphaerisporangium album]RCG30815.1 CsbD family protein [Sphaerisporangium album]
MGLLDKWKMRELRARAKRRLGASTGNRTLAAEGRTEEAEARLLQTEDQIKQTAREIRAKYARS